MPLLTRLRILLATTGKAQNLFRTWRRSLLYHQVLARKTCFRGSGNARVRASLALHQFSNIFNRGPSCMRNTGGP
jgi:hypothetical protein